MGGGGVQRVAAMRSSAALGGGGQGRPLAARQAAHLTVLRARLVHEGAVKAGPHGRRGGGHGGATHGAVALRAGGLAANRTWREGEDAGEPSSPLGSDRYFPGGGTTYCTAARWWPTAPTSSTSGPDPRWRSSLRPGADRCCPAPSKKQGGGVRGAAQDFPHLWLLICREGMKKCTSRSVFQTNVQR